MPGKGKTLVILESGSKVKKVQAFLGNNYIVKACFGHCRDLPVKTLGVDPANNYEPVYETQYTKGFDHDDMKIKTNFEYFLSRVSIRLGAESITRWHPAESNIPEKTFLTLSAMWSDTSYQ